MSETELDDEDDEKFEMQLAQEVANKKLEIGAEEDSQEENLDVESLSESDGLAEEEEVKMPHLQAAADQEMADAEDEIVKKGGKNSKRRRLLDKWFNTFKIKHH